MRNSKVGKLRMFLKNIYIDKAALMHTLLSEGFHLSSLLDNWELGGEKVGNVSINWVKNF